MLKTIKIISSEIEAELLKRKLETGGAHGETKDNYHVVPEYRDLIQQALEETLQKITKEQMANQRIQADAAEPRR